MIMIITTVIIIMIMGIVESPWPSSGATAIDNVDPPEEITANIVTTGAQINTAFLGVFTILYGTITIIIRHTEKERESGIFF